VHLVEVDVVGAQPPEAGLGVFADLVRLDKPLRSDENADPTLVMSTTRSRSEGRAFHQRPRMVSDSPPELPGAQAE